RGRVHRGTGAQRILSLCGWAAPYWFWTHVGLMQTSRPLESGWLVSHRKLPSSAQPTSFVHCVWQVRVRASQIIPLTSLELLQRESPAEPGVQTVPRTASSDDEAVAASDCRHSRCTTLPLLGSAPGTNEMR